MANNEKPSQPTSLAEVNSALAGGTRAAVRDRIVLRDAVCAYLNAERARGTSLATITETLKGVLTKADGVDGGAHEIAHQLVDWCIGLRRAIN